MKKIKNILIFCLLYLCTTQDFAARILLQSLANVEQYHTDEGNEFKLIKLSQGCRIDAKFYFSFQQQLYSYTFSNHFLNKATLKTFSYRYKKGEEGSLGAITDVYQSSSEVYRLDDLEVQKKFKEYQALFPTKYLKQCN